MAKYSLSIKYLSSDNSRILVELGERIRFARKRRGMTLLDLATRAMTSLNTLQRIEKGDAGISLGVLISTLMCLGLEKDLNKVAAMETDTAAFAYDRQRLMGAKRRRSKTPEEKFFEGL